MDPLNIAIVVGILVFSVILHELAHGYAALYLGDPTAKLEGRLTLNPIVHIDPIGSIIIPLILALTPGGFIFGWAKPVPYNPYNLSNQRWGEAFVAVAGSATNLLIALVFGLFIRLILGTSLGTAELVELASYVVLINLVLAVFNLIPFPPIDGSKVLAAFLPPMLWLKYQQFRERIEQYGFISTVLFLIAFLYVLWAPFQALISKLFSIITGIPV
jgi:Zn-dependent protease